MYYRVRGSYLSHHHKKCAHSQFIHNGEDPQYDYDGSHRKIATPCLCPCSIDASVRTQHSNQENYRLQNVIDREHENILNTPWGCTTPVWLTAQHRNEEGGGASAQRAPVKWLKAHVCGPASLLRCR